MRMDKESVIALLKGGICYNCAYNGKFTKGKNPCTLYGELTLEKVCKYWTLWTDVFIA